MLPFEWTSFISRDAAPVRERLRVMVRLRTFRGWHRFVTSLLVAVVSKRGAARFRNRQKHQIQFRI